MGDIARKLETTGIAIMRIQVILSWIDWPRVKIYSKRKVLIRSSGLKTRKMPKFPFKCEEIPTEGVGGAHVLQREVHSLSLEAQTETTTKFISCIFCTYMNHD